MGEYFDQIPSIIQNHIQSIAKDVTKTEDEDALEKVSQAWLDKKATFEQKTADMGMGEVDGLGKDEEKGALALTYSGSLVNIGPIVDGVRNIKYTSIGFRTDAPESAERDSAKLVSDIAVDKIIEMDGGPVKSTSQIFKVAVCTDDNLSADEQIKTIIEAADAIEEDFVEVNKTIME